ncbi:MAG: hypothetical protein R3Y28_06895 [Candidatus Gastranaerophilales bacterium]
MTSVRRNYKKWNREKEELEQLKENLEVRLVLAESNVLTLLALKSELKEERPMMIAHNKDISKLNERLKSIDEEIEINQDAIIGIGEKLKKVKDELHAKRNNSHHAFKELVKEELSKLEDEFNEKGEAFAQILKEYTTLEFMMKRNDRLYRTIAETIPIIPNLKDSANPLYQGNAYEIWKKMDESVRIKYKIPNYQYFG